MPPASSESSAERSSTETPKPQYSVIVTRQVPGANVAVSTGMALRRFVERLKDSSDLTVTEGKELNRKEANELAKKGDAYVIWLQLEVDLKMDYRERDPQLATVAPINPGCLLINYAVFAPGTAKVVTQGRVYQDGYQAVCASSVYRPSPLPPESRSKPPTEYTLRKAAREAADRVMTALDIPIPPTHPLAGR